MLDFCEGVIGEQPGAARTSVVVTLTHKSTDSNADPSRISGPRLSNERLSQTSVTDSLKTDVSTIILGTPTLQLRRRVVFFLLPRHQLLGQRAKRSLWPRIVRQSVGTRDLSFGEQNNVYIIFDEVICSVFHLAVLGALKYGMKYR
jgi:hypothetical protein